MISRIETFHHMDGFVWSAIFVYISLYESLLPITRCLEMVPIYLFIYKNNNKIKKRVKMKNTTLLKKRKLE